MLGSDTSVAVLTRCFAKAVIMVVLQVQSLRLCIVDAKLSLTTKMALQSESGGTRSGTVRRLERDTLDRLQNCIVTPVPAEQLEVAGTGCSQSWWQQCA